MPDSTAVAPVRVFLIVMVTVFASEAVIMLGPVAKHPFSIEAARSAVIDALVLVAALCPVLWLLVVRPMRSLLAHRSRLLARVFEVQEEERARLARDLHDEIGQAQTAVQLGLRSILNSGSLEETHERAQTVYEISAGAIDATRRITRGLSPSVLIDFGLPQALEGMCHDMRSATGLAVEFRAEGAVPRFRADAEFALYRVAQEALTNAVRHSRATRVLVSVALRGRSIELRVSDDGIGLRRERASSAASGLGLAGMRERVAMVNGRLEIRSSETTGTEIVITVPMESPTHG